MNRKLDNVLDAALPAALVATIAGTCFSGADYIVLMTLEDFAESLGFLPPGWEDAHAAAIRAAVAVMTALVAGFVGWWMYRTARTAREDRGAHC